MCQQIVPKIEKTFVEDEEENYITRQDLFEMVLGAHLGSLWN